MINESWEHMLIRIATRKYNVQMLATKVYPCLLMTLVVKTREVWPIEMDYANINRMVIEC